jgi:hypothetical protein
VNSANAALPIDVNDDVNDTDVNIDLLFTIADGAIALTLLPNAND